MHFVSLIMKALCLASVVYFLLCWHHIQNHFLPEGLEDVLCDLNHLAHKGVYCSPNGGQSYKRRSRSLNSSLTCSFLRLPQKLTWKRDLWEHGLVVVGETRVFCTYLLISKYKLKFKERPIRGKHSSIPPFLFQRVIPSCHVHVQRRIFGSKLTRSKV